MVERPSLFVERNAAGRGPTRWEVCYPCTLVITLCGSLALILRHLDDFDSVAVCRTLGEKTHTRGISLCQVRQVVPKCGCSGHLLNRHCSGGNQSKMRYYRQMWASIAVTYRGRRYNAEDSKFLAVQNRSTPGWESISDRPKCLFLGLFLRTRMFTGMFCSVMRK